MGHKARISPNDLCFFCSRPIAGKKSREHVVPNFLLRKWGIKRETLSGVDKREYAKIKVTCLAKNGPIKKMFLPPRYPKLSRPPKESVSDNLTDYLSFPIPHSIYHSHPSRSLPNAE